MKFIEIDDTVKNLDIVFSLKKLFSKNCAKPRSDI